MIGGARRKDLFQSVVLSTLLVAVALAVLLGEPDHFTVATGALLIPGFGIPLLALWLTRAAGLVAGRVFPTWLLLSTWLLHYAFLIVVFFRLQAWWGARKGRASELHA